MPLKHEMIFFLLQKDRNDKLYLFLMTLKFKYYLCTPFSEKPTANYCETFETFNETFKACKFSMKKVFENCANYTF